MPPRREPYSPTRLGRGQAVAPPNSAAYNPLAKVRYRPMEAAIRWSGLARYEAKILAVVQDRALPVPSEFPKWPALLLNAERIVDGIVNHELPCAMDGITATGIANVDDPRLTIRHVDLKLWMAEYYPEQKPDFLFSPLEQLAHPTISMDTVRLLVLERDTVRAQLEECHQQIQSLRVENEAVRESRAVPDHAIASDGPLSLRGETAYLNIIGCLRELFLGESPSGQAYSVFKTQEAIISAMLAHFRGRLGISERTLHAKFAEAKRRLSMG